ncbi:hypothetical protein [Yersinia proxima]|uniref:hypothetical protein n=1 Tax=Yersinia proxima TaxID=2890316 RepID=UPI001D11F2A9|nr:hypothetical protein [Yersinia proxima]ELX2307458.1 hypothetical protein [Yersinia enterocolitica]HEN3480861.1 hypothetical protein [Yersinia enterocolitica]
MAKTPGKQQASISELGGLPPEFEADIQQQQIVAPDNSEIQPEPKVQNVTPTANEPAETPDMQEKTADDEASGDHSADDSDEMEVVVVKGQTLRHSGETYAENSRLFLPCSDASRLIDLGVVADVKTLRQQAARISGPSITVDDGVKIERGG